MSIAETGTPPNHPLEIAPTASPRTPLAVYDPKLLSTMLSAFRSACRQLPAMITGAELGRRNLARRILVHVDRGERDVRRLAYLSARDVSRDVVPTSVLSQTSAEESYSSRASTPGSSSRKSLRLVSKPASLGGERRERQSCETTYAAR
jgi:hypothetical protein